MSITSEYTGGYEIKNIIPRGIYEDRILITDSCELIPEDKKSIFSFYLFDSFRAKVKVFYCISSDDSTFSEFVEALNVSTPGNYIFFCINADLNGFIKFKIEITGRGAMEFNQLGVLKGVRTRSFILLEGPNEHRMYQSAENLAPGDPVKLINISGDPKLAKLSGNILKGEAEINNNGALPVLEVLGNTAVVCFRNNSTNMLMIQSGLINYDNTIAWNTPSQVYSSALSVSSVIRTFAIKKLSDSKFVIGFVCAGGNAYLLGGDLINGVLTLGTAASAGTVSASNPFCNIVRISENKFIFCTFASSVNYVQYRCCTIAQSNTFTLGSNFTPVSTAGIFITGCMIDENNSTGPLFIIGVSLSGGIGLYSSYVQGTTSLQCEANVIISTSSSTINEFSIDQCNTTKGILSYTVDDSTHKLAIRFLGISRNLVSLGDQFTSNIDAASCSSKIISPGKLLNVFFYPSGAKLYSVISDFSSSSITWGAPVELASGISSSVYSVKALSSYRQIIVFSNESLHTIKQRMAEDDRGLFLGIMNEGCQAGSSAEVKIISQICSRYSGLVPGEQYFIQPDGSIANIATSFSAGFAVSDTELLVQK